jgi:transcriptional regulator with XRE-family HTH domain
VVTEAVPAESDWTLLLRQSRQAAALSRDDVARRCGVSAESLRAYETGRRRPSRDTLNAVLDALAVDPARRNAILRGAGFTDDATWVGRQADSPEYSFDEATALMREVPWPAHINSETFEVLAANDLIQAVWGIDMVAEFPDPVDRNMAAMLTTRRFGDPLVNWDAAVTMFASMVKGGYGAEAIHDDGPNSYLAAVTERLLSGDPSYVQRFLRIWNDATGEVRKWRFTYPVVWQRDDLPEMRFLVIVSPANLHDYMTFNDWVPVDAATWQALGLLADSRS